MGWLVSLAGAMIVALVLRELFHTVWHPRGRGRFDRWVTRAVWRVSGRSRRRGGLSALSGPLSLLLVVLCWAVLTVLGWALVYWPHLPGSFSFSPGLEPGSRTDLLDSVYLSSVTLTTLGFGDVVPTAAWLRIAVPVEALIGFAILTAAVSWGLQIQPALTRRRVLAVRLDLLARAGAEQQLLALSPVSAAALLTELTAGLAQTSVDLAQYAETYYFRDVEASSSLAATLGHAEALARRGTTSDHPDVRLAARVLSQALDDLAQVLDEQFTRSGGSTARVLAAYAAEQGHPRP